MGIYSICLGKGIIIPVKVFMDKYMDEIRELHKQDCHDIDLIYDIIKRHFGEEFTVSQLGHDALESRNGMNDVLGNTINSEIYLKIKELRDNIKREYIEPFEYLSAEGLIFIGKHTELDKHNGEFGYYLKTPELIYGLTALIPQIISYSVELTTFDTSILEKEFDQTPCIWTFTNDCACCG